jgi:excinuclease ABC subunit C
MHEASEALEFERAVQLRDLIGSIRKLQARESVENPEGDLDVLAASILGGTACVVLLSVRDGRNLGTRTFFPKLNGNSDVSDALGAFLSQYYFEHAPPREIVVDRDFDDREILQAALTEASGRAVQVRTQVRGRRAVLLDMARRNVATAVNTENASQGAQAARVASLVELLGLTATPKRVECFDISHTQGEATVASCVVFDEKGAVRDQYRRYNITGITPGDDYAAMHQALSRRFRPKDTLQETEAERVAEASEGPRLPDVLLIDGGEGQLKQARDVMRELGVEGVVLVGVAKGEARKAGHETLILDDGREVQPGAFSPALQYIQQVRDEAHRFAITGHRGKRQKARTSSKLEEIEGIGPRKRAALLKYFGGLGGLKSASVLDIAKVEGISEALAERIYAGLHGIEAMDPDGTQG